MKYLIAVTLMISLASMGLAGCSEKPSTVHETKIETPRGTTTITIEKEGKKSGDDY
jgi:hypothetical protein